MRAAYAAVVDGAWAEVGDLAVDHGQPWSEFSTPRQAAERLSRGMSEPAAGGAATAAAGGGAGEVRPGRGYASGDG